MFYRVDFICNDDDELQSKLNILYGYKDSINLKVKHRNRMNLFYTIMEQLIDENVIESFDSAIDIGCNSGAYSKIISDFGFNYVLGVDIDDSKIRTARDHLAFKEDSKTLEYRTGNAVDIGLEKKFDLVLCAEVIEHTSDPGRVIANIKSIIAPGGVAIITLPNSVSLPFFLKLIYYRIIKEDMPEDIQDHLDYPFYKAMKLLKDDNLKIVKTSGSNLIFFRHTVRFFYDTPAFPLINRMNFYLSKSWPLRYLSHSFLYVIKNTANR